MIGIPKTEGTFVFILAGQHADTTISPIFKMFTHVRKTTEGRTCHINEVGNKHIPVFLIISKIAFRRRNTTAELNQTRNDDKLHSHAVRGDDGRKTILPTGRVVTIRV